MRKNNFAIVIQIRNGSIRLPGKALMKYKNKTLIEIMIKRLLTIYKSMGPYEVMQLILKPNDSKHKIYGITGVIPYRKNINACYKKNNKIVEDIKENFPNAEMTNHGRLDNPPLSDPYGGTYDLITFDLNKGRIQTSCNDWSELSGIIDSVKVEIFSSEFTKYLQKVLY